MRPHVLIVEDEAPISASLRYNLESEGFRVTEAGDGEIALLAAKEDTPDMVILDLMIPHIGGFEVCRQMRRHPDLKGAGIIMLTARGEEADRVRGLQAGADDYVAKPFSMQELIARVRAVMRRVRPALAEEQLNCGTLVMDLAAHKTVRNGRAIHLGPTEFKLLRFLIENAGRVMSRDQILGAVWGPNVFVEERTVDVHVGRLRKALSEKGEADPIRTVRSAGYALDAIER